MTTDVLSTQPTQDDPLIMDRLCGQLENMAVDVEAAVDVLDDPNSSESARSLAMSTLELVPNAIRFYISFFANCTHSEESSDE